MANKPIFDKYGRQLVPLRIDRNTVLLVTRENATAEFAERWRKSAERSRRLAVKLGGRESAPDW